MHVSINHFKTALYRYRILLVCTFLFTQSAGVYGQKVAEDTATVLKLYQSAADSINTNEDKSLKLAEEGINISKRLNFTNGIVNGLCLKSRIEASSGKSELALSALSEALQVCNKNGGEKYLGTVHRYMGMIYGGEGEFDKAITHFDTALKIYLALRDSNTLAGIYNSMGVLMDNMNDFDKANEYLLKAAEFSFAIHNQHLLAGIYCTLGGNRVQQKKYGEAITYSEMAIRISDSIHANNIIPLAYLNIAESYDDLGNGDSALYYSFKSLDLFKQIHDVVNETSLLGTIANIYDDMKQYDESEKYFKKCLGLARQNSDLLHVHMSHFNMSNMYYRKGDFKLSADYKDSTLADKDSLFRQERARALVELTTKYETKEIEQKNTALQRENDIQKLRLQRKSILMYSGFGVVLFLLIIVVLLIRQNKLKDSKQKLEVEQKQLLAQMNPHFIFNCLNSIQHFVMDNDKLNANRYLADFALLMRQTLDNSKDGMISLAREIEYLDNYLSFEYMRFKDKFTYSIECAPDIDADAIELPSMIIQPFVENAIRHGLCNLETRAGVLNIRFYKKEGFLYCEVDDNGIGIDEAQKLKEHAYIKYQSHGMELTRKRLALVSKMSSEDYNITIINKKRTNDSTDGTTIIIKFPLQP